MRPQASIGASRARPARVISMSGNAPTVSQAALATSPTPTRRWRDVAGVTAWCLLLAAAGTLLGMAFIVTHLGGEPEEEQW